MNPHQTTGTPESPALRHSSEHQASPLHDAVRELKATAALACGHPLLPGSASDSIRLAVNLIGHLVQRVSMLEAQASGEAQRVAQAVENVKAELFNSRRDAVLKGGA